MSSDKLHIKDFLTDRQREQLEMSALRTTMSPGHHYAYDFLKNVVDRFWVHNRTDGQPTNPVFLSKVLADLIRKHTELDFLTRGWYMYGLEVHRPETVQLASHASADEALVHYGLDLAAFTAFERELEDICVRFDCNNEAYDWERLQYNDYQQPIYLTKLDLQVALNYQEAEKISYLLASLSSTIQEEYDELPKEVLPLLDLLDHGQFKILQGEFDTGEFAQAFDKCWQLFACFNHVATVTGENADEARRRSNSRLSSLNERASGSVSEYLSDLGCGPAALTLSDVGKGVVKSVSHQDDN